ncbi:hypothetical protein Ddye_014333 [Dipteronia dyeriana]|uniref:Uncharacterized protein n=1 Tax=Dipteronia dyeriana TaxID=168575 RepID=A0AAE0CKG7_9ROSI|nr:hypothetical protein Ddye_014333 [Dipteronia dyeriana]
MRMHGFGLCMNCDQNGCQYMSIMFSPLECQAANEQKFLMPFSRDLLLTIMNIRNFLILMQIILPQPRVL